MRCISRAASSGVSVKGEGVWFMLTSVSELHKARQVRGWVDAGVVLALMGGGVSSRGREEGRQLQPASCNKATYVIFKCAGGEGGVDIGGTGARRWEGEGAEGEGGNIARQRHGVNLRWWWVKQQCHGGWDRLLCSLSSMGRGTHPAFALPSLHTHTDIHTCAAVACNPGRA